MVSQVRDLLPGRRSQRLHRAGEHYAERGLEINATSLTRYFVTAVPLFQGLAVINLLLFIVGNNFNRTIGKHFTYFDKSMNREVGASKTA
jgi:hypothetical protein